MTHTTAAFAKQQQQQQQQKQKHFIAALALLLLAMLDGTNGLGEKTSDLPLFESTPTHCDNMIELHRWEGSCCSLNVTEGNGCILNVMNGDCKVKGQEWTLNYVSTYDELPCPPSEYSAGELGMKTEPPSAATRPRGTAWSCLCLAGQGIMVAVAVAMAMAMEVLA
eukprot:CAMPEP_0172359340 /NCGR_PEP_ID=MMETSP1060-20121228/3547_1 /TAXON_ID=37318 /ORGANISM="Pseudo-nitzschia pungens, Strain cf. cingulata" /LENGTH=165 /DNA_ID=CAMNT_0013080945 /DNA_START=77 /DNA_END=574 /DNA_ORIENTATION=+